MEAFVILGALGLATGIIGRAKGGSFLLWFTIGFILPVLGLLAAVLHRSEHAEPERRCPRCGRVQKLYVQVCSVCGEDLYLPEADEVRTPGMIASGRAPKGG